MNQGDPIEVRHMGEWLPRRYLATTSSGRIVVEEESNGYPSSYHPTETRTPKETA